MTTQNSHPRSLNPSELARQSTTPAAEQAAPQEASVQPGANRLWWQRHGGQIWLEEIERRRPAEPRYRLQERWLYRFMAEAPPSRVLDYGCGYGRHLRYLRLLKHLDLYGCDISPPMIELAARYVGDEQWAAERIRLFRPEDPIPFPDHWFDVTYTSEVLIHVAPDELDPTFRELLRVTDERLVLIENVRSQGEKLGSIAHEGSWLHDFDALAGRFGLPRPTVLTDVLADQHIYVFELQHDGTQDTVDRLRRSLARREADLRRLRRDTLRDSEALALLRNDEELQEVRTRLERALGELTSALDKAQSATREAVRFDSARRRAERRVTALNAELDATRAELARVEASLARRIVRGVQRFPLAYRLGRRVIDAVQARPRRSPEAPRTDTPTLAFAGVADRASVSTREQFLEKGRGTVGICHPDWRGIRAATYALSDAVLEIAEVRDEQHARELARFLADVGPRVLAIHGIMPGTAALFPVLRKELPRTRLLHVYHGGPAQETFPAEIELIQEIVELTRNRQLDGIGFLKQGMAECYRMPGVETYQLFNKIRLSPQPPLPRASRADLVDVGLFVPQQTHKNFFTQLLGALALTNARVHVLSLPASVKLGKDAERVVVHGVRPHAEFLKTLGSMDANLYVTLSECYPMTVLESLQAGVPCLTSDTSPIFDDDEELRRLLVVRKLDDPSSIGHQLRLCLDARAEIGARADALLRRLNQKADELWEAFTSG